MVKLKIADGIAMLKLPMNITGRKSTIYPTLIWDAETVILVDSGAPGTLDGIKNAMENAGVPFGRLSKIIITHQDIDHIGGLKDILDELPEVEVLAHEADKPYIQGEKKLVRLNSKFMDRINSLPDKERKMAMEINNIPHVEVKRTLRDNEQLSFCGGIKVIHTPGHTPGHICLYHEMSKTLIAGDELNIFNGELVGPNEQIMDEKSTEIALKSLSKLEEYDIENVISYHGGLFNDNPHQKIKELKGN